MSPAPDLSLVITTYNRAKVLADLLQRLGLRDPVGAPPGDHEDLGGDLLGGRPVGAPQRVGEHVARVV